MRDHIVLFVNGRRREVRSSAVFQSLSDYIRHELGLMGTKVVCAEGDCGSCTILLGRARNDGIEYVSVCSCIYFVFQADGCHIVTVEGLGDGGDLTPVQQAIADHHGTQCGFCTPGIVMSIHALLERDPVLTEQRLREGLVGNLCRCTGYDPILRAGLAVDACRVKRMNQLFNSPELKSELVEASQTAVRVECEGKMFYKPLSVEDAVTYKGYNPDAVVVSGGTDLGVQVNKGGRDISKVLSTTALAGWKELHTTEHEISAGANVSIAELDFAAADALPEFKRLLARFGSPQIKNAATLGGNIANGSPIGDTLPALFVLDAEVELAGVEGTRRVRINDFYTGYKKNVARPDELIQRVIIPRTRSGEVLKLYKVSKRVDLDISTFSAAIWMKISGERIEDVRIAYGGVAPTVKRLPRTEAKLKGHRFAEETFAVAAASAVDEVAPISDVRSSATYRSRLAGNILRKLYHELNSEQVSAATTGTH